MKGLRFNYIFVPILKRLFFLRHCETMNPFIFNCLFFFNYAWMLNSPIFLILFFLVPGCLDMLPLICVLKFTWWVHRKKNHGNLNNIFNVCSSNRVIYFLNSTYFLICWYTQVLKPYYIFYIRKAHKLILFKFLRAYSWKWIRFWTSCLENI